MSGQTNLRNYFPMIKEREEILRDIEENERLRKIFYDWEEQERKEFLDFCSGVKGVKILYDSFFKEIMNPEYTPDRLNELLSYILGQNVKIMSVLPNDSTRIADENSLLIMDILVQLEDGSLANLEVQKLGYMFGGQRSACYSADLLLRQYKRMRDKMRDKSKEQKRKKFSYKDIKPVYTIVFFEKSPSEIYEFQKGHMEVLKKKYKDMPNKEWTEMLEKEQAEMVDKERTEMFEKKQAEMLEKEQAEMFEEEQTEMFDKEQTEMLEEEQIKRAGGENKRYFIHRFKQTSDTGLELELLQRYVYIGLDIFKESSQNRGIKNKFEAWLTFLSTDEPEKIIELIESYPEFKRMYEDIYNMCLNIEKVMGMYSRELLELDRNTVDYMIDEMQNEIEGLRLEMSEKDKKLSEKDKKLSEKDRKLSEKDKKLSEKDILIKMLEEKLSIFEANKGV